MGDEVYGVLENDGEGLREWIEYLKGFVCHQDLFPKGLKCMVLQDKRVRSLRGDLC